MEQTQRSFGIIIACALHTYSSNMQRKLSSCCNSVSFHWTRCTYGLSSYSRKAVGSRAGHKHLAVISSLLAPKLWLILKPQHCRAGRELGNSCRARAVFAMQLGSPADQPIETVQKKQPGKQLSEYLTLRARRLFLSISANEYQELSLKLLIAICLLRCLCGHGMLFLHLILKRAIGLKK